jgi:hypothetical protein
MSEPISFDLHLPAPPPPGGNRQTQGRLRRTWKGQCDMHTLAQLCGAPRVDGAFSLAITLRQNNNGAVLTTCVGDLLAYLKEREFIHSAGPAHLRKLVLAWGSADEAPDGVRLELRELGTAA